MVGWLAGWLVGWFIGAEILPTVNHKAYYFFCFHFWGASLGRTESINEVKRDMNSLCNVQKIEQVKPKMMFLVFFYNVVLLAFFVTVTMLISNCTKIHGD